ncbi:MAG: DUF6084 family protein [Chloroflexia bacterium]
MPNLSFEVEGAGSAPFAAAPLLIIKLRVTNEPADEQIQTIALLCQIRIETPRRHYGGGEHEKLLDLFGTPDRWSQTLRSMLWTFSSVVIPPFTGSTVVDLPVHCTYDFNVASAKYFYALEDGEVPLTLLFSGTVFYATDAGLQIAQIPWDREATYRLPVLVWKDMMDHYYPNSAWITLRQDVFDRLYLYKIHAGLPSWEETVEKLLAAQKGEATG